MKRKPKIKRAAPGQWQVEHPPFGFSVSARTSVHRSFRQAVAAARGGHGGSAAQHTEKADQHDYDTRQAPA